MVKLSKNVAWNAQDHAPFLSFIKSVWKESHAKTDKAKPFFVQGWKIREYQIPKEAIERPGVPWRKDQKLWIAQRKGDFLILFNTSADLYKAWNQGVPW